MSTNENNPVETPETNLDDFATEFFGESPEVSDNAKSESQEDEDEGVSNAPNKEGTRDEADEEVDNTSDEADNEEDDDLASGEDETDEGDEDSDKDDPAPKKTRFQKRIDELTAKAREEERQRIADREAYEARIAALEEKLGKTDDPKDEPTKAAEGPVEPTPDAKNEDGTDKYPLGEYDPKYIKDMAKYTFETEFAMREQKAAQEKQAARDAAEKAAIQEAWTEKLTPAQERYPDFQEKGQQLLSTFEGIDQAYGEYLSTAIMSLDNGPDVLYYLASNPEEANQIVQSGPMRATAALGRIDSEFRSEEPSKSTPTRKVSKAPAPPPRAKGTSVGKARMNPYDDGVDLDALSRELAKKSY